MAGRSGGVETNHIRARQVKPLYLSPRTVMWKNMQMPSKFIWLVELFLFLWHKKVEIQQNFTIYKGNLLLNSRWSEEKCLQAAGFLNVQRNVIWTKMGKKFLTSSFQLIFLDKKTWIHAIRCYFREYDFIKTLSSRRDLRSHAVPSLNSNLSSLAECCDGSWTNCYNQPFSPFWNRNGRRNGRNRKRYMQRRKWNKLMLLMLSPNRMWRRKQMKLSPEITATQRWNNNWLT